MFYKNRSTPRSVILLIDTAIVLASILMAYLLRFNFKIPQSELMYLPRALAIIMFIRVFSFLFTKSFAGIIRYTETQDISRIFIVIAAGSIVIVAVSYINYLYYHVFIIPRAVLIIEPSLSTIGLVFFRLVVKVTYNELKSPGGVEHNVVIFGAGEASQIARQALVRDKEKNFRVVAIFDDNPKKKGKKLENVSIRSGGELETFLAENDVDELIIAVQNISITRKKEIAELGLKYHVKVKDVPPVSLWINGELSAKQIKNVSVTDLLDRDEIPLNKTAVQKAMMGKVVLITGAAGSIGSEIARQLLPFKPAVLILLDQGETPLFHLELELSALKSDVAMEFVIGDIRDRKRMRKLFSFFKPEIVFHSAAYKHVPLMENNPAEAVQTNVFGTKNIADLALEYRVEKFVMISTDKAVNPTNVMGASKRIAEMYIQSLNKQQHNCDFITTRFGNVLGSNGSVIPLFRKQIEERKPITITHPEVTRYFMTIPEASRLVLEAAATGEGNEIFVFDMGKSVKILDVAKKMVALSGLELGKDVQIVFTGLRPGEKLYEEVLANNENTLPTAHSKILKARVREFDAEELKAKLAELADAIEGADNQKIVAVMKKMVPEFKSKNSVFEVLDKA